MATGQRVLVVSRGEAALAVLRDQLPEKVRPLAIAILSNERQGLRQVEGRDPRDPEPSSRRAGPRSASPRSGAARPRSSRSAARLAAIDAELDAHRRAAGRAASGRAARRRPSWPGASRPSARRTRWFTDRPEAYRRRNRPRPTPTCATLAAARGRAGDLLDHLDAALPAPGRPARRPKQVAAWHDASCAGASRADGRTARRRPVRIGPRSAADAERARSARCASWPTARTTPGPRWPGSRPTCRRAARPRGLALGWTCCARSAATGRGRRPTGPGWRASRSSCRRRPARRSRRLRGDRPRGRRRAALAAAGARRARSQGRAWRRSGCAAAARREDAQLWQRRRGAAPPGGRTAHATSTARWRAFAARGRRARPSTTRAAPPSRPRIVRASTPADTALGRLASGARSAARPAPVWPATRSWPGRSRAAAERAARRGAARGGRRRRATPPRPLFTGRGPDLRHGAAVLRRGGRPRRRRRPTRIEAPVDGARRPGSDACAAAARLRRPSGASTARHRRRRRPGLGRAAAARAGRSRRPTRCCPPTGATPGTAARRRLDLARIDARDQLARPDAASATPSDRRGRRLFVELVRERAFLRARPAPVAVGQVGARRICAGARPARQGHRQGRRPASPRRARGHGPLLRRRALLDHADLAGRRAAARPTSRPSTSSSSTRPRSRTSPNCRRCCAAARSWRWATTGRSARRRPSSRQSKIDAAPPPLPARPALPSLLEPGESLYDLMRAVFPDSRLMLKEHFRCVEPIIRFSMQFYPETLVPLRVPSAAERLDPPLVDIYVPHGEREGARKINRAEARGDRRRRSRRSRRPGACSAARSASSR